MPVPQQTSCGAHWSVEEEQALVSSYYYRQLVDLSLTPTSKKQLPVLIKTLGIDENTQARDITMLAAFLIYCHILSDILNMPPVRFRTPRAVEQHYKLLKESGRNLKPLFETFHNRYNQDFHLIWPPHCDDGLFFLDAEGTTFPLRRSLEDLALQRAYIQDRRLSEETKTRGRSNSWNLDRDTRFIYEYVNEFQVHGSFAGKSLQIQSIGKYAGHKHPI